MKKRIAVIGCGSTGMATAAWLTSRNIAVTLCDTEKQAEDFDAIRQIGGICLEGALSGEKPFPPRELTNDFTRAVSGADVILVCVSARRQEEILARMEGRLSNGQLVLLIPGNMGSVHFKRRLRELGKQDVTVAELCGNLWACRRTGPGRVLVALPASAKYVAAYPAGDTAAAIRSLEGILEVLPAVNIIEATLNSPNIISHVAGSLLNAVQIERQGEEFALFLDGLGESYITCTNRVEWERNKLLERMGLRILGEPCEKLHRILMGETIPQALVYFKALKGPSSFSHRYVTEDATCGLALMVSLAMLYGTPVSFTRSCLVLAGEINRTDYLQTGRTAENLDIYEMLTGR